MKSIAMSRWVFSSSLAGTRSQASLAGGGEREDAGRAACPQGRQEGGQGRQGLLGHVLDPGLAQRAIGGGAELDEGAENGLDVAVARRLRLGEGRSV